MFFYTTATLAPTPLLIYYMSCSTKRFAIYTLGCKLNFSESSDISRRLCQLGFERVDVNDEADIYIVNTCSVTEEANKKCRQMISRARRHNANAFIAVTGCYAQLQSSALALIPGVSLVLGNNQKHLLVEQLSQLTLGESPETQAANLVQNSATGSCQGACLEQQKGGAAPIISGDILRDPTFVGSFSSGDRTRTFLKIQDGCDYFCSYCTIPFARGLSRSGSVEQTVALAHEAAALGAKEIVLTGVNIGDFGRKNGETFLQLVEALEQVDGVLRYRISSIEPNLLTDEIIAHVAQSPKFMPHFHVPLQSGSDTMLGLMRRRYKTELYAQKVRTIKELMPHAFIGVDVIVGVNGETEALFQETVDFVSSVDVTQLHVFSYSERPGTKALSLTPVVPVEERHKRNALLHQISEQKRVAFYAAYQGTEAKVLVESPSENGLYTGFTHNYIRVELPATEADVNTEVSVKLGPLSEDTLSLLGTRI